MRQFGYFVAACSRLGLGCLGQLRGRIHRFEMNQMHKLFWLILVLPFLVAAPILLQHLHFAFAQSLAVPHPHHPFAAPEIDPQLAVEGLVVAGGLAVFVWERIRRRR